MDDLRRPTAFDHIRDLMAALPGPDRAAAAAAADREQQLTKPAGALGRLEELAEWLATWQGRHPPRVASPRVCVFAGNHGVAARGVSAYPAEVTAQMVANFAAGGAAINQLTNAVDGQLQVIDMDLANPTADFCDGPAMDEAECVAAMVTGMDAIDAGGTGGTGGDLLAVGEMGIANTTSAAALALALFGGTAEDWTGPGTGVAGAALDNKARTVAAGVARHGEHLDDPLRALACLGGRELAAIAGAIIAARRARMPVLIDGYTASVAAAVLFRLDADALDHCQIAHLSAEPAHGRLCAAIGKRPLLDLGMRLGEGSGAALAISIVKAAADCHAGMATFADAGVSGKAE